MNSPMPFHLRRTVLQAAIAALAWPAASWAMLLPLSTSPAGGSFKLPAPNVIVSVDDSGSMGASGVAELKAALQLTFSAANVPDGSIRMAWQAMTNCFLIPSPSCSNLNVMKVLNSTHRANFMSWVNTLGPIGNTPSHRMLRNAGEYLRKPLNSDSAWASVPGTTLDPVLSCRRSYNVFMTDGGWNTLTLPADNAIGDADNTAKTLPDGTAYNTTSADTQIFRSGASGPWSGTTLRTTLSDMAFYYWATDLQPTLNNDVKSSIKSPGVTTFSNGRTTRDIPEYWNPQNDPATWQHMTMYTVGYNGAANWTVAPKFGANTWTDDPVTKDYSRLMLGLTDWPNPITGNENVERITELWHMALNSRGKFIPAPNAVALTTAFQDILNEIISDNSQPTTSLSASASSLNRDSAVFAAGYDATGWVGRVAAYGVAAGTGDVVTTSGLWGTIPAVGAAPARAQTTADIIDGPGFSHVNRVVLSSQSGAGIDWNWASLSTIKQTQLNTNGTTIDARGQERLNFLRGDRTNDGATLPPVLPGPPSGGVPSNPFRNRASRHGDIVNSEVWFTPGRPDSPIRLAGYAGFQTANVLRKPMLYVGANDGMLHGFDSGTGIEKIAYVPDGLHAKTAKLSNANYVHEYFVDGSPFTADIYDGTNWKTYLAGFPGLGGKGYFVLNVTDPTAFGTVAANQIVVLDNTATADPDIGHIVSQPVKDQTDPKVALQLTRMNNGRWALVTGNGANSTSEKAVLLLQFIDQGKELVKIPTDNIGGNGNGLSAPRLVDVDGDRIPDVAYAGDLRGNLWKFDLTDPQSGNWKVVGFGSTPPSPPLPLYVAIDSLGNRQPISTAPGWLFHPNDGLMIAVGTGRHLTDGDRVDGQVQSLYGIYDSTAMSLGATNITTGRARVVLSNTNNAVANRTALVRQTISTASTASTDTGSALWTVTSTLVPYTGTGAKKGWFIDLPVARERAYKSMDWFRGRLFKIPTGVPPVGGDPNVETCTPTLSAGAHFMTVLDIINGSPPPSAVFAYGTPPAVSSTVPSRVSDPTNGTSIYLKTVDSTGDEKCETVNGSCSSTVLLGTPPALLRPTWRQAQ